MLALLAGCGDEPAEPVRIAALGDSIIEGLGPIDGLRNCGVFGQTTDQIAERLDDCADGAQILVIQGGINDVARGRPVDEIAEELREMVRRGKQKGLRVRIADVLPWNNGHPEADSSIAELNRQIERIGRDEAVPVLGFHDALEDPKRPGTMKPELTSDGSHPSDAGNALLKALIDR